MSSFYMMEAANLFCGDHDPSDSKHLTLEEFQLPNMQEIYQEHHAGGSMFQVEFAVGVEKLGPTFKLKGFDPAVLGQFGLGAGKRNMYTAYGVIRDKRTGIAYPSVAVIEGRLGKANADAFKRGELQGHEYAINEVMHYELSFNGGEVFYFDFFASEWRVGGVDQNADANRILQIGG